MWRAPAPAPCLATTAFHEKMGSEIHDDTVVPERERKDCIACDRLRQGICLPEFELAMLARRLVLNTTHFYSGYDPERLLQLSLMVA